MVRIVTIKSVILEKSNKNEQMLGTGHKVTARVGWSDLGWASAFFNYIPGGAIAPPGK